MRISDWSSDVCSSDLTERRQAFENLANRVKLDALKGVVTTMIQTEKYGTPLASALRVLSAEFRNERMMRAEERSEEHTSELQSLMRISYAVFCLKNKTKYKNNQPE